MFRYDETEIMLQLDRLQNGQETVSFAFEHCVMSRACHRYPKRLCSTYSYYHKLEQNAVFRRVLCSRIITSAICLACRLIAGIRSKNFIRKRPSLHPYIYFIAIVGTSCKAALLIKMVLQTPNLTRAHVTVDSV